MKRTAFNHPKMYALSRLLRVPLYAANGLMARLWHHVSEYAPTGDISKYPPQQIAEWCGCALDMDPDAFLKGLIEAGWIDRRERKLLVHDWPEHCEHYIHNKLARHGLEFADGSQPDLSRLPAAERTKLLTHTNPSAQIPNPSAQIPNPSAQIPNPSARLRSARNGDPSAQNGDPSARGSDSHNKVRTSARAVALPLEVLRKGSPEHSNGSSEHKTAAAYEDHIKRTWPQAVAYVQKQFPRTDAAYVGELVKLARASITEAGGDLSKLTDENLVRALYEAKFPKQESAAGFKKTLPEVVANWSRQG